MKVARLNRLGMAVGLALATAFAGTATATETYAPVITKNAQNQRVVVGAEHLGTVVPHVFYLDLSQRAPEWQPGDELIEIPKQHWSKNNDEVRAPLYPEGQDQLALKQHAYEAQRAPNGGTNFEAPVLNILGSNSNVSPPDPTMDVGIDHAILAVNGPGGTAYTIFNKADGSIAAGPLQLSLLGGQGPCANGLGDPIVMFDEIANRWVLTEFSTQAGQSLCVYVSSDPDPTAAAPWFAYTFTMPSFPDYPKYGVWNDAYYAGANESGTGGARPAYAFDRTNMLAGNPASFQRLTIPNLSGFNFQMTPPVDFDGVNLPPAGAPGLFIRHRDDESHGGNAATDFLEIFELDVDFATPGNTALTGPISIPIAEFSSNLNGLTAFNAFPQPNSQKLDPLREVVMNKPKYINFGTHESIVGNLVTDVDGNDLGGVRWFELRRVGGLGNPWTLHQEGTYSTDDLDRWMGASAMDLSGNIALGYSVTHDAAPAIFPELRYVGRQNGDPLGVMTTTENTLVTGQSSNTNERWGDYHDMGLDPVDGCTFWFTGLFRQASIKGTQIGAFKFASCGDPTFGLAGTNTEQSICANPGPTAITPVDLTVTDLNGFAGTVDLTVQALPTGFSGGLSVGQVTVPPVGNSQLTLNVDGSQASGANTVTIEAESGAILKTLDVNVFVVNDTPAATTLTAPADAATGVSTSVNFSWDAIAGADGYLLEVATDAGFSNIVVSEVVVGTSSSQGMAAGTEFFWRVTASNACGGGVTSAVFSFTTANEICVVPNPGNIPDGDPVGIDFDFNVANTGTLLDLEVSVDASHTWVGDLIFTLTHNDTGTSVILMDRPGRVDSGFGCNGANVDVVFSDAGTGPVESECAGTPPAIGGTLIPQEALSAFDGEDLSGSWTLSASDNAGADTGSVNEFCLLPEVEVAPPNDIIFQDDFEL